MTKKIGQKYFNRMNTVTYKVNDFTCRIQM